MSDLSELREHLTSLQKTVAIGEQVKRLKLNRDFDEKLPQETRELANNMAKASAVLDNYLKTLEQFAQLAQRDIEEVQETILNLETGKEDE